MERREGGAWRRTGDALGDAVAREDDAQLTERVLVEELADERLRGPVCSVLLAGVWEAERAKACAAISKADPSKIGDSRVCRWAKPSFRDVRVAQLYCHPPSGRNPNPNAGRERGQRCAVSCCPNAVDVSLSLAARAPLPECWELVVQELSTLLCRGRLARTCMRLDSTARRVGRMSVMSVARLTSSTTNR